MPAFCSNLLRIALTASLGPSSVSLIISQISILSDQFSEAKPPSVANSVDKNINYNCKYYSCVKNNLYIFNMIYKQVIKYITSKVVSFMNKNKFNKFLELTNTSIMYSLSISYMLKAI